MTTSAQRNENRLTPEDEQQIRDRMTETVRGWHAQSDRVGQPAAVWGWTVCDTLQRIGGHAIGCSPYDLRDSERAWIARRAREALGLQWPATMPDPLDALEWTA